ncbi:sigma-54-dependent Fis family transcriptional regulator [Oceanidesulfovibrio indonesiensis]|uniref:Sigma-54-dependent Fis family transcriptional regulator n=1 Tax=Oceanidesulfovibrio indonesiensis TaxID=54767 RepID=A0A7M3MDZ1_9BACT|nr:sigma-54-dependent Fis family transcriptional regulator [Oceanidesulfovibrio indonesiensis]TVM16916.1 sigma-54-dependent Fis family transcriptional regulator [Oceanidesulfovibrio indonesiensis]
MYSLFRDGDNFGIRHDSPGASEAQGAMLPLGSRCKESSVNYAHWKQFMEKGWLPEGGIEKALVDSWRRCLDMGVDHAPRSCWDFIPMKQLEPFTSVLGKIGADIVSATYNAIKGKQLLITITNANGRVAQTCGDLEVLRQADKLNFGPGANWAEESVGTNAIGTALATGRPMQVFGEEHFCLSHHSWSCTAAPVLDPHGNVWGCFDISGEKNADHSNSLSLVLQASRAMEQRLCQFYCSEIEGKMSSLFSSMFNTVMMGIITLDNTGHVISSNSAAESLLGRPGCALRGRQASSLFDFDTLLAKMKHASMSEPVVLKCFADPSLFVRAIPIFDTNGSWNDTIVTISEPQRPRAAAATRNQKKNAPVQGFEKVLHSSAIMRQAVQQAANAARTPSTVLLYGESGTGKELFAKGIHQAGPRNKGPFVAVNCGAFSGELIQSELFGYMEGAFTGAMKRGRIGRFEKAHTGVLFLDEISEMPLQQQVNLLRVLEERAIVPVGGNDTRSVDVKVIAGTNKNLWNLVEKGEFREDLYYRLNVVGISIPPLRKRGEDILLLARQRLHRLCAEFSLRQAEFDPEVEQILMGYDWPGNVRELFNCLEHAVNNLAGDMVLPEYLPSYLMDRCRDKPAVEQDAGADEFQLKKREADTIREALEFHDGNISKTAKALGIGRNTLYAKMEKFHIQP